MIKKHILLILFASLLFSENNFSIEEQNNIAKKYIENSLYEEALSIYKNILVVKKIFLVKHTLNLLVFYIIYLI